MRMFRNAYFSCDAFHWCLKWNIIILGEQKVLNAMALYDIMHKIRRQVLLGGWKFIFSEVTNTYTLPMKVTFLWQHMWLDTNSDSTTKPNFKSSWPQWYSGPESWFALLGMIQKNAVSGGWSRGLWF